MATDPAAHGALARLATWTTLGILSAAVLLLVAGFTLIGQAFKRQTSEATLDSRRRGYTADEAIAAVGAYGEDGRRLYLWQEVLDFFFPAAYSLGFATMIALGLRAIAAPRWVWVSCAVPFVGAAFDYLENVCVTLLLLRVPRGERPLGIARVAGFATVAKWRGFYAALALAVAGLLIAIVAAAMQA